MAPRSRASATSSAVGHQHFFLFFYLVLFFLLSFSVSFVFSLTVEYAFYDIEVAHFRQNVF